MTPAERIRAAVDAVFVPGEPWPMLDEVSAAVCEALADVVVPEQHEPPCGEGEPWPPAYQHMSDAKWEQRQQTRSEILAIAADLRGGAR